MEVQVGPSVVTIHSDDHVVVCEPNSDMSSTLDQGYFARDTRFVSGYRLKLGRDYPVLLNSSDIEHYSSRFEFTNPALDTSQGTIPASTLHLRLDRTVGNGVHEDYDVTNYSRSPVVVLLEVSVESDFADLFDVKARRRVRRGTLQSTWDERRAALTTRYENGPFRRSIEIKADRSDSPTEFANGGMAWRIELEPGASWHTCLMWTVDVGGQRTAGPDRLCHAVRGRDTGYDVTRRGWSTARRRTPRAIPPSPR